MVGRFVGSIVGRLVGSSVGAPEGPREGIAVGTGDGDADGDADGASDGPAVGSIVGSDVGVDDGAGVASSSSDRRKLKRSRWTGCLFSSAKSFPPTAMFSCFPIIRTSSAKRRENASIGILVNSQKLHSPTPRLGTCRGLSSRGCLPFELPFMKLMILGLRGQRFGEIGTRKIIQLTTKTGFPWI